MPYHLAWGKCEQVRLFCVRLFFHASAALGARPTQSASGPVRSRPTRSGRAVIGLQPQNRTEAAPSVRLGAKLHTTQSLEPTPASQQPRERVGRGALSPSPRRRGARSYAPGGAAPGTSRSLDPGQNISTAKLTCGWGGGSEGKTAVTRRGNEPMASERRGGETLSAGRKKGHDRDLGGQAERWRSRRLRAAANARDASAAAGRRAPFNPARRCRRHDVATDCGDGGAGPRGTLL